MQRLERRRALAILVALVSAQAAGCSSSDTSAVVHRTIGTDGGEIVSPDGRFHVVLPSKALAKTEQITIRQLSRVDIANAVGKAYEITPDLKLAVAATVSLTVDPASLGDRKMEDLVLGWKSPSGFKPADAPMVAPSKRQLSGITVHFSTWGASLVPKAKPCVTDCACWTKCCHERGWSQEGRCGTCTRIGSSVEENDKLDDCYGKCAGTPKAPNFCDVPAMAACCRKNRGRINRACFCVVQDAVDLEAVRKCSVTALRSKHMLVSICSAAGTGNDDGGASGNGDGGAGDGGAADGGAGDGGATDATTSDAGYKCPSSQPAAGGTCVDGTYSCSYTTSCPGCTVTAKCTCQLGYWDCATSLSSSCPSDGCH